MSQITVKRSNLFGSIEAAPSKSEFIRTLFASFLCFGKKSVINYHGDLSDDIKAAIASFEALGAYFDGKTFCSPKNVKNGIKINVGESATLFRIMFPVLSAIGGNYTFKLGESLKRRPIKELQDLLALHGITSNIADDEFSFSGKLTHGRYEIRGDISSQYISGLLFALPLLKEDSEIVLTSVLKSSSYVDMTVETLKNFGIKIEKTNSGYFVVGDQKYENSGDIKVNGDYSGASYYLLCGALLGEVTVFGLNKETKQSDSVFVDILEKSGAEIKRGENYITAKKGEKLSPMTFDVDTSPDLAPTLAVMAAFCDGKSILKNVDRLRSKESDRVESIIKMHDLVGIETKLIGNDLEIYGGNIRSGEIDGFSDHRIAMAATVLLLNVGGKLNNYECVTKSEPNFYENIRKLGGIIE